MKKPLSRRSFVNMSVAAGVATGVATAAHGEASLLGLLSANDAEARVYAALKPHLGLNANDLPVVSAFVTSLRTSCQHTESPEAFAALLKNQAAPEAFAIYVLQEFVVTTNYLAVHAGEASTLKMLTA